jgi:putative spermidine/putrescine transport system permease protein
MKQDGIPFLVPLLALSVLGFLLPLLLLGVFSFMGPSGELTLDNYQRILGDPFSVAIILDTLRLGFFVVLGTTLLGLPVALLYWHAGPRLRMLIVFLTLLPMLTSNVVRTFAWIVLLGRQGPLAQALYTLGLTPVPQSLLFTEGALVLVLCQIELPLLVLPLIATLSRADRSLVTAAETLGAGRWRTLVTVLLPLAAPGLLAGWILVFAAATTSYVTQSVIGGARNTYLPQVL